jgi:hypothetical protein
VNRRCAAAATLNPKLRLTVANRLEADALNEEAGGREHGG